VFHIAPAFTSLRWLPQNWADDVLDGRISRTCLLGAVVLLGNVIFVGGEVMEHEQIHGISMEHG
jgi:hypothetical protein